jgi:hypothetical protein
MKAFLYCFSLKSFYQDSKQDFQNIYKISTTVRNINDVLSENNQNRYVDKGLFSLEFAAEFEDIQELSKLEIFEKLYNYKYGTEEHFYKIDLMYIKKFLKDDIKAYELRKRKLLIIKRFLRNTIQKTDNFSYNKAFIFSHKHFAHLNYEIQSIKIGDLYEVYTHWCKLNYIKDKAEICEFFDLCESHTFLGKANEDYEWEFVSLKTMNSYS